MKQYIRTTHNFNNETREWDFRGDRGGDKQEDPNWRFGGKDKPYKESDKYNWSMGPHTLKNDRWNYMRSIIDETINCYKNDAADGQGSSENFKKFCEENPNYREIIKQDILREFEYLISIDMVRVRDNKQTFSTDYWDT